MTKIKYPEYSYEQKFKMVNCSATPVSLDVVQCLLNRHHFVLAWDGDECRFDNVTLGILTGVTVTAGEIRYTIHTCSTDIDLPYDNAAYIENDCCPEVLVKTKGGSFVGNLIGIDHDKGMAVVQFNNKVDFWSISTVTYVKDVNTDLLGLRVVEYKEGNDAK